MAALLGTQFIILAQMITNQFLKKTIFAAACVFLSHSLTAQKLLNEAVLKYNISIETANDEKPVASSLNGAVLTIFLTKNKSRSEMMSVPGKETNVFDEKSGKGFILKEYSGQKLMITVTKDNWNQKTLLNRTLSFTTEEGVTSIVAGYQCQKAVAKSPDGKIYTVYYTNQVTVANQTYNNSFPQLKGLPVQYELSSGNLIFRYTLTEINPESIDESKFEAPKNSFRVMTYEENQQLKKG